MKCYILILWGIVVSSSGMWSDAWYPTSSNIYGAFNKIPDFYRHLKWTYTLENSVCHCYTSYEMTDQFLWFQLQMNSYISTRTIHQSTTPSLSQTIWPRWASRQFLSLPIVQTLLLRTFAYSLSSEAVITRQLRRWKSLWWRSLKVTQEDFHGAFQKLLEWYKCIAAGGDYFEGDYIYLCHRSYINSCPVGWGCRIC